MELGFWCDQHYVLTEQQTKQCWRIRFMVKDSTGYAPFVVLGRTAERVIPLSAEHFHATCHLHGGVLPLEIEFFRGKEHIFDVYVPAGPPEDAATDLLVSQISGQNLPKTQGPVKTTTFGPRFAAPRPSTLAILLLSHTALIIHLL